MGSLSKNRPEDKAGDQPSGASSAAVESDLSHEMLGADEGGTQTGRGGNPYTPGVPVESSLMFFGREDNRQAIEERIAGAHHTAVVGPPEIGVSSLLRRVAAGLRDDMVLTAYINLSESAASGPSGLARSLWSQWWEEIRPGYVPEIGSMGVLAPLVRRMAGAGYKVIAILDEYEHILWRPSLFNSDFHGQLETLVQDGAITLLTGSHAPLAELHQQADSLSTIYSHTVQHDLGLLTKSEAVQLLMTPLSRARLRLSEEDGQYFADLAGPHPLFLQLVGAYLFDSLLSGRFNRGQVEDRFKTAAEPFWQDIWHSMPPPAKTGISASALNPDSELNGRMVRVLQGKGLVRGEGRDAQLFSRGFAEWVTRMQTAQQFSSGKVAE